VVQAHANPAAFMSLLGKVLPMTIADAAQNEETKFVFEQRFVWPKDKDGNIIWPEWAREKDPKALSQIAKLLADGVSVAATGGP
jgi:hypothetical protein